MIMVKPGTEPSNAMNALREPARTGDEELRTGFSGGHGIEGFRLVNVCEAVFAQPGERVYVCSNLFHDAPIISQINGAVKHGLAGPGISAH